ncbi:lytic transglycosylase domain-containing protein [Synechococcus sp. CCY 9618]|uniref:lytic transglycosylase domain-containing protein n=1 Tax=Synechococcus sp. CCY 9618 TaxID=2815602 RepID=UPI001C2409BC|nr:lytic transglycosylase domain-containing protein [Synechococcus sp. CCY 9618]
MRVLTYVLLASLLASAATAVVRSGLPPDSTVPSTATDPAPLGQGPPVERPQQEQAAAVRSYPRLPSDPAAIAAQLVSVEEALRSDSTDAAQLPELGHRQQVIYRRLSEDQALANQVRVYLSARWQTVLDLHVAARREFLAMHRGERRSAVVPAWRIIPPEAADQLLRYYREAAAATGIPWEVLAAVNLVETGMGRIDGVSVADARGPMQFLPSTWAEPGIGKGNIRDPQDAIHAAARYLVRRGGLRDIRRGLWGYNNSNHYVNAVLLYAQLLREDPAAFTGLYHWEIHYASSVGDLWLPVGYDQPRPLPVGQYLRRFPASAPPEG